ncbi:Transducin/WD40 repeat-like superfamily protein [Striga hermonthica]|uniref:Transducin/WD40 repeat-like superfamily protein n=1 Tax=Striga hermonthica TaxID=68872 RepID=A0A9N7NYL3_STRHE|nr:Transducin/WD40 repeat-like superfamily protein [Striga hermonthica]
MSPENTLKPGSMVHPGLTSGDYSGHLDCRPHTGFVATLARVDGHVYSLATSGGHLYTGSSGKSIHVWRDFRLVSSFTSDSGLVKSIVIFENTVFTGHQDGKIRIWRADNPGRPHRRAGTLPALLDVLRASVRPRGGHVEEARRRSRRRSPVWVQHADAVSCLSMSLESNGCDPRVLYSASWDGTFKAWRVGPGPARCMESVRAHDDAVNSVAAGPGGVVYTGSADGTVKAWRERDGRHVLAGILLRREAAAVTAVAVGGRDGVAVYAGLSDGTVEFWEAGEKGTTWAHGGVLRGHGMAAVLCLAAGCGGRLVMSGSADGRICVWRRREEGVGKGHDLLSVLKGHAGPVKCLAVEKDVEEGRWMVYSGSLDKSVKVWSVSEM